MKKAKIIALSYASIISIILVVIGVSWAAFADKGSVKGTTFSVGSSDLKLLVDLTKGGTSSNLSDEISGPHFENIGPNWSEVYLVKVYNNGTSKVQISSNANYETANDPDELRQVIYVEPFLWEDSNNNGQVDTGEEGQSLGKKTIVKWKTEGFNLGELEQAQTKGIMLKFSTESITESKQGKTGTFDFEFDSLSI